MQQKKKKLKSIIWAFSYRKINKNAEFEFFLMKKNYLKDKRTKATQHNGVKVTLTAKWKTKGKRKIRKNYPDSLLIKHPEHKEHRIKEIFV